MKVFGRDKLTKCGRKHAASKNALDSWFYEVNNKECRWESSQDIKDRYSSASFLSKNRVIFNIKGNKYRLVVKVRYKNKIVVIEWVGPHSEYDKKSF